MHDRRDERAALEGMLQGIRVGQSSVLVLRGEAGIGKTALMEFLAEQATECRVARAAGVQAEMELAFAGLHHLCSPLLYGMRTLPEPQQNALQAAFGMQDSSPPDRFLVALAVLSLLAEAAESRPLVCLVEDAHWLDRASAQVLAFVARRLLAERIAMVFAVREPAIVDELAGLPELRVEGLPADDARSLLESVVPGRVDGRVRERILSETRGNPLALLELPRGLTPAELAGGFGLPDARPLAHRIEHTFLATRPGPSCRHAAPAADRRGRAARRFQPAVARRRAARDRRRGRVAGRGRRSDRARAGTRALQASAGPLGGLPGGGPE